MLPASEHWLGHDEVHAGYYDISKLCNKYRLYITILSQAGKSKTCVYIHVDSLPSASIQIHSMGNTETSN